MNFTDPSMSLLAASCGDTVKLFGVSKDPGDPCILTHTPSPGYQVNSVKLNHTNLVVASTGDDKKIALSWKSGLSIGTIPAVETNSGDNIEDDNRTPVTQTISSHLSSKTDEPASVTPPEDWGGERASDKFFHSRQQGTLPSRFATLSSSLSLPSGSMMTGLQDPSLPSSQAAISFRVRDNSSNQERPLSYPEVLFGSTSLSPSMKSMIKSPGLTLTQHKKISSYAERMNTNPSFSDVTTNAVGSPKTKKTGAETREKILNTFSPRHEMSAITESGISRTMNIDMSNAISSILDTQAELIQEIKSLRKENQELRKLL